jgi:hypothetical protein
MPGLLPEVVSGGKRAGLVQRRRRAGAYDAAGQHDKNTIGFIRQPGSVRNKSRVRSDAALKWRYRQAFQQF